jgi:uncharacterized protein
VSFPSTTALLHGSVWYPNGVTGTPGLVLIGGSGPTERSNDGYFDPLRDHLVATGIAVLAYDKRGVGRSSGSWATATVDDLATDAQAAERPLSGERCARTARTRPLKGVPIRNLLRRHRMQDRD